MAFPIVLWNTRTAEAKLTSDGEWQAPLDNLKSEFLTEVARSKNLALANTRFDIELAQERAIRAVVLLNTNCEAFALYKLTAATEAAFTPSSIVYQGEWTDAFPRIYSWETLRWGDPRFWFGRPVDEDLAGFPRNIIMILPETIDATYWRVEIDDRTNRASHLDLGRLLIAGGSQASQGYARGAGNGIESGTQVSRSRGNVKFFRRRPSVRVRSFTLPWLPRQEGMERWWEMQRQMGLDGEVFVIPDADDEINLHRNAFRGRLRSLSPVTEVATGYVTVSIEIEEG